MTTKVEFVEDEDHDDQITVEDVVWISLAVVVVVNVAILVIMYLCRDWIYATIFIDALEHVVGPLPTPR